MSNIKSRFFLLVTLFVGLSIGVFFGSASNMNASPALSPDGKTCTPCHEERGPDGSRGAASEKQPAEQAAQQPAEQPVESSSSMSPEIIVVGVIAILAAIYFFAIKKKK